MDTVYNGIVNSFVFVRGLVVSTHNMKYFGEIVKNTKYVNFLKS